MPLSRRRVTDPAALKALAHATRLELLELLVLDGPKTATQAAAVIGGTPANASWHLRKLAAHGFVREVTGAKGRARPWRAVSEALMWGDPGEDAETSAAGEGLTDVLLEREMQRFRAARAALASEPPQWREASTLNRSALWLTAAEANKIAETMRDLFLSKADRFTDQALRPEGSRLISLVGWVVPHGPLVTTTPVAPGGGLAPASPPGPAGLLPPG